MTDFMDFWGNDLETEQTAIKGGTGSGHHKHAGRPGKHGGSASTYGGFTKRPSSQKRGYTKKPKSLGTEKEPDKAPDKPTKKATAPKTKVVEKDNKEPDKAPKPDGAAVDVLNDLLDGEPLEDGDELLDVLTMSKASKKALSDGMPNRPTVKQLYKYMDIHAKAVAKKSGLTSDEVIKLQLLYSDNNYAASNPDIYGLRQAASKVLNAPLSEYQKKIKPKGKGDFTQDQLERFVKATYEYTQERLKAAGFNENDTLTVFRGVRGVDFKEEVNQTAQVRRGSVESWTLDSDVARDFASVYTETSNNGNGTVIATKIPINKIFSMANHGFGEYGEREVLLLGGVSDTTILGKW